MTFWVQHGYGKGDKLRDLYGHPSVSGVVLSPADERASTLLATSTEAREAGWIVACDPQTYVYSIPEGQTRCHKEHGVEFDRLSWAPTPSETDQVVTAVQELNEQLNTSVLIGPTPLQASFDDRWSASALQHARAGFDAADRPFYASIVVGIEGFANWDAISGWLDEFTTTDFDGVYLVVAQPNRQYPTQWRDDQLTNVLRLVHRLTVVNRYELVWGYSDIEGLLGVAAGATSTASGWYYTLRSFFPGKWQPSGMAQQAQPRVLAPGLLSPLEAVSEASQTVRTSAASQAFGDDGLRSLLRDSPQSWGLTDAWSQHLRDLAGLVGHVAEQSPGTSAACDTVEQMLGSARALFQQMSAEGAVVAGVHQSRLEASLAALRTFRAEESV